MTDEESNEEPPPIIAILNIYKVKIFLNIKSLLFFLFFVSGFCGLLYQIIWLRIAFASFGVISPILSVVISVFMLGLSLGSWAGGKWIPYL